MSKIWQKGYELDALIEQFTVGEDPLLDAALIAYDCAGSIAHAKMLAAIGVLTEDEFEQLRKGLRRVARLAEAGRFEIKPEEEDVHTAVETHLTGELGDLGKKLHTARSRNDQVILDLRLYMRERLLAIAEATLDFVETLLKFADAHKGVPIPGRTHFQRAMPSSVGLWAGAFAESLLDDIVLVSAAYQVADQCPLGSAASYGVNLPIDRQLVSDLLGFQRVQNNVLYANNSRGKVEAILLSAMLQIMLDLAKLSTDAILFGMPEFGYFRLPEEFCPGSSLMPQKRNPGPFELMRAKAATVQGYLVQVTEIVRPLPSGYHRDFQETKGPLMRGLDVTLLSLRVAARVVAAMKVDAEACVKAFTPELFATDRVLDLVKQGVAFRDAYRQVAADLDQVEGLDPVANIKAKTHLGAPGNLGLDLAREQVANRRSWVREARDRWQPKLAELLKPSEA